MGDPKRGEACKRPRIEDTLGRSLKIFKILSCCDSLISRRISELKPGQVTEAGDSHGKDAILEFISYLLMCI